jgi:hypothetical protein
MARLWPRIPGKLLKAFVRWTQSLMEALSEFVVSIDGQALRSAIDQRQSPQPLVGRPGGG